MVSTVKSPPNHYERLGLTPSASDEDVARAFAREAGPLRAHAIAELAQITVAFETLRNPDKRRDYDASLGLRTEAAPPPSQWQMPRRDGWPFVTSARVEAAAGAAITEALLPEARSIPRPPPEAAIGPTAPFVAAQPRTPVEGEARRQTPAPRVPEQRGRPDTRSDLRPAQPASGASALHRHVDKGFADAEDGWIAWKRPALVGGGLLVGVALLGAWLGSVSGGEVAAEQPDQAVTLTVPDAKAAPPAATLAPAIALPTTSAPVAAETQPKRRIRSVAESAVAERAEPPPEAPALADMQPQAVEPEQSRIDDIAAGLAVDDTPSVSATSAKLPLPDAVVARTIRRIGYGCGQVASTTAVEGGAPGVFKVTCTSGESYRAAPVRGRYHFRKWDRR